LAVFTNALQELGWADGRNVQIDYRWAAADVDRMQAFAKELVDLQPSLIVGQTTQVVAALQRETRTIPIVFVLVSDPVGSGFVASLPRPAATPPASSTSNPRWRQVDRAAQGARAAADARVTDLQSDTATYSAYYLPPFETAARTYGIEPIAAPVRSDADIERVIADLGNARNGGLVAMPDSLRNAAQSRADHLAGGALPRADGLPISFMVDAGGLISYGIDNVDLFRRAATYVDRILKGTNPADLPVQLPSKFELVVNLKTAKTLGSTCRQRCSRSPTR